MTIDEIMAPIKIGEVPVVRFGLRQSHRKPYNYVAMAYWQDGTVDRAVSPRALVAMAAIRKMATDGIKERVAGKGFEGKTIWLPDTQTTSQSQ